MSPTDRLRAADPLAGGLPPALPAPALPGPAVTERAAVGPAPRRRPPVRQAVVALAAALAAVATVLVIRSAVPARHASAPERSGGAALAHPAEPSGPLWLLAYNARFAGGVEHAIGTLRFRIPPHWRPIIVAWNHTIFRVPLGRCVVRTTATARLVVSAAAPPGQARASLGGYALVARGPRAVAPAGAWAIGSQPHPRRTTADGRVLPSEPRLFGLSVLPLGPPHHALEFRVHAVGCPRARLAHTAYVRELAGVLAYVHPQTRRERGQPVRSPPFPPPLAGRSVVVPVAPPTVAPPPVTTPTR